MKGAYRAGAGTRHSVIAFVDILGFKEAMADATRSGKVNDLLGRVKRFIGRWRHALTDRNVGLSEPRSRYWEIRVFSDNILISHPIEVKDLDGDFEFSALFSQVGLLQVGAVEEDWFVRGGIAVGEMYIDRDIVFGLPLAHAYEAESRLALQPRVVLADSAQEFVTARITPRASSYGPYAPNLLKGEDGRLFVNYLEATIQTSGEPLIRKWVEQHGRATSAALKRYSGTPDVHSKYVWVARYHNYWCRVHGLEDLMLPGQDDLTVLTLGP